MGGLESTMAVRGKALTFSEEEIDDLVETPYSSKRVFPLLALLFPAVNTRNLHHVDHIWPRALFKRRNLLDAGVPPEEVEKFRSRMNGLPNLQLLEGTTNVEKQQAPPLAWASTKYGQALNQYLLSQELLALTPELQDFLGFYNERRERLRERLREALTLPVVS
jgi:hypothetical protein